MNYWRWELLEEPEGGYDYLIQNTWVIEACLNHFDFDEPENLKIRLPRLDNRLGVPLDKIYPRGYELLLKESRRSGPEWKQGQPLGPDPTNENHRKTHLGWVPPRYRDHRRGLGADITDSVQKHWFFGKKHSIPLLASRGIPFAGTRA
ncbi:hypothetical protein F4781DRAFT_399897 [Annulohypoxylon bovei var. microspora]|nr:hypothetical protein F4781DRAFT_399897 [Annulohypoxylon bovei var. microspora]